jgi:hypothetical protein
MSVVLQLPHPDKGYFYINPADIIGYRTALAPDIIASPKEPIVLLLRNGATEAVIGVSVYHLVNFTNKLKQFGPKSNLIVDFEGFMGAVA